MDRSTVILFSAAALLSACAPKPIAAKAPASRCLVQADTATALVHSVQLMILMRPDSVHLARHGLLPVDTAAVHIVTDDATCANAVEAYNREKPPVEGRQPLGQIYVVQVGADRFVIVDLQPPESHYRDYLVFDAAWVRRGGFAG